MSTTPTETRITLRLTDIVERLNLSDVAEIKPASAHIGADGRAMLVCELWAEQRSFFAGLAVVVLSGTDFALAYLPPQSVTVNDTQWGAASCGDGLLFVSRHHYPERGGTAATLLPRVGMQWLEPEALQITDDLPVRVTDRGYSRPVLPRPKGIGRDNSIAWPVRLVTDRDETSVKSVIFFQPDRPSGQLNWSYWPEPTKTPRQLSIFSGGFGRLSSPDFIQPNPEAFPTFANDAFRLPNVCSAVFDGERVLITSDGATEVNRYGDRCAAVSELRADGSVHHLHLDDFVAANAMQGALRYGRQAQFVGGGRKALFKSRYASTDPWHGGFALFDLKDEQWTSFAQPEGSHDLCPMEIVGDRALFAAFDASAGHLNIDLVLLQPIGSSEDQKREEQAA